MSFWVMAFWVTASLGYVSLGNVLAHWRISCEQSSLVCWEETVWNALSVCNTLLWRAQLFINKHPVIFLSRPCSFWVGRWGVGTGPQCFDNFPINPSWPAKHVCSIVSSTVGKGGNTINIFFPWKEKKFLNISNFVSWHIGTLHWYLKVKMLYNFKTELWCHQLTSAPNNRDSEHVQMLYQQNTSPYSTTL